jgi:hypothetical protein
MRPIGAQRLPCEVEFLEGVAFAVTSERGLEVLRHHDPKKLIRALYDPRLVGVELIPRCELIRVTLEDGQIPHRFYMTSQELEPCETTSQLLPWDLP